MAIYFLKRFLARGFEFVLKMYTELINGNLGESFKKVFSKFEVLSSLERFLIHFPQIRIFEISSKMSQTFSYLQNWILYGFSPKRAVLKMYSTVQKKRIRKITQFRYMYNVMYILRWARSYETLSI